MTPAGGEGVPPRAAASIARRLAAMAYEGLVVAAILLLAGFPFAGAATARLDGLTRHLFQAYLVFVLGLYFVWCWRRGGQTLPMKAWKLRVVDAHGRPLVLLRYPRELAAWLALAPGLVTLLWSAVDRDRQFLHDRLAGTRIVAAEPPRQDR